MEYMLRREHPWTTVWVRLGSAILTFNIIHSQGAGTGRIFTNGAFLLHRSPRMAPRTFNFRVVLGNGTNLHVSVYGTKFSIRPKTEIQAEQMVRLNLRFDLKIKKWCGHEC